MARKVAVVCFNLGGPDRPEAVKPFLFNLFNDPAIIGAPNPIRWLLARFISHRRAPVARKIYDHLGGRSPLLELTEEQCRALETALRAGDPGTDYKAFIAMRYWHPMSLEAAERVCDYAPDEIVLLPLYPQFSTTTTGSSLKEWARAADMVGVDAPTRAVCCYPENEGWIAEQARLIGEALTVWPDDRPVRVLFSAHGLPKKIIDGGDPYQWQVERTSTAVLAELDRAGHAGIDGLVCYQSRVGPLEWIGPSVEQALEQAAADKTGVIVVPIAFVSEHSETLVELDIEYRALAERIGILHYVRVPAVAANPSFIEGLSAAVRRVLARPGDLAGDTGIRICPAAFGRCAMNATVAKGR